MTDLMFDLETFGVTPGAAIVGLGACFFDTTAGTIGERFYRSINLATCTKVGLTIDAATCMWWLGQPDPVRDAVRIGTIGLGQALDEFDAFVARNCAKRDMRVWSRGPSFDCAVLGAAYRALGRSVPWLFWNERCHRTLTARNPSVPEPEREGSWHKADDDCVHQSRWLIAIAAAHRAKAAQ